LTERRHFLPIAVNNAGVSLEELLPDVLRGRPSLAGYELLCRLYRQLGVGALLLTGRPTDFRRNLFKSGRAFAHFSEKAAAREKLTSRAEAFFDAVACRDDQGARRIARASPARPDPSREYEEDFYALRCPMDLLLGEAPATVAGMLEAWAKLGGGPDPRRDLWRAILQKDQKRFERSLVATIRARRARYRALEREDRLDPDEAATLPHVSVEALAALELARRAGLKVGREYPTAPAAARRPGRWKQPAPSSWKVLDQQYSALDGPG
jgi:hypothetical protein